MAATLSSMIPLGTKMPPYTLPDATGELWQPSSAATGYVVVFMCNHCPFVIHIAAALVTICARCEEVGIEMCGINSNDTVAYQEDAPSRMIDIASKYNWLFPYLVDESQEIAKKFGAVCTPDVFLYDRSQQLFYRGQLDETRPNSGKSAHGADFLHALDLLIAGAPPPDDQKPALGCNIKWK